MDTPPQTSVGQAKTAPVGSAVAIALSVFVGVTSIFAAVMAAAIAPFQVRDTGITGVPRLADDTARWMCYALAVAIVLNGFFTLRVGRRDLRVAIAGAGLFAIANVALGILYVKTW